MHTTRTESVTPRTQILGLWGEWMGQQEGWWQTTLSANPALCWAVSEIFGCLLPFSDASFRKSVHRTDIPQLALSVGQVAGTRDEHAPNLLPSVSPVPRGLGIASGASCSRRRCRDLQCRLLLQAAQFGPKRGLRATTVAALQAAVYIVRSWERKSCAQQG